MVPARVNTLSVTLLCVFFLSDASCASRLIQEHLSNVELISVAAMVPRYDPIPGIAPDDLERDLKSKSADILREHGLDVGEGARLRLRLTVDYRISSKSDSGALLVVCELREEATLAREWHGAESPNLHVTSWSDRYLTVATPNNVLNKLAYAIDVLVVNFAEEVIAAKARRGLASESGGHGASEGKNP